ncbi:MAG TPA: hypothetical protein VGB00_01555 [Pyrinomonadaceae bacterium]
MAALFIIFIFLYILVLAGKLESLREREMVMHLEPIIFVLIGYYFGRSPAQQNEKLFRDEITRQTNRADAAQSAKERAQQVSESLEEKIKNAKTVLSGIASDGSAKFSGEEHSANGASKEQSLRNSITTTISILKS